MVLTDDVVGLSLVERIKGFGLCRSSCSRSYRNFVMVSLSAITNYNLLLFYLFHHCRLTHDPVLVFSVVIESGTNDCGR
jgi:hypothetical protein